jgi:hypothetical protein
LRLEVGREEQKDINHDFDTVAYSKANHQRPHWVSLAETIPEIVDRELSGVVLKGKESGVIELRATSSQWDPFQGLHDSLEPYCSKVECLGIGDT